VTNVEVLRGAEEVPSLWKALTKRRSSWIGHTLRHDGLLLAIPEGGVEVENSRGRPRSEYITQVIKDLGCHSYTELKSLAGDRQAWRTAANQPTS
jgi:hypothetical protein